MSRQEGKLNSVSTDNAKYGSISSLHCISMDNYLYFMPRDGLEQRPSVLVLNEVLPSALSRSISISRGQIVSRKQTEPCLEAAL